jgi:hypothetical protein
MGAALADPVSGGAAATGALLLSTGTMAVAGQIMPPGASLNEFIWGCLFAIIGAFSYQFVEAQALRQAAADRGIAAADRPKIDMVMVGYSMFGAPMAAACLIYIIHQFWGGTGFGAANWLQSAAGFMVAGAAGPKLVFKVVGAFLAFASSKTGGKTA